MLSIVLSLGAHACLTAVMRHAVLTDKDISAHVALSRGQNAQVSATVSFIDPEPEPKPPDKRTKTPNPQIPFEHLEFDSRPPEIPLSSALMHPGPVVKQPPVEIDAIELEPIAGELEISVIAPNYLSAPVRRIEVARLSVSLTDRITIDAPRTPVARSKPRRQVDPKLQIRTIDAAVGPTTSQQPPAEAAARPSSDSGVTEGAKLACPISPEYPTSCVRRGQQGAVILEVRVLATGRAGEIKVFKSSGYAKLDVAAIAAMRRAPFLPARKNGRNVESWIKVPVRFVLR